MTRAWWSTWLAPTSLLFLLAFGGGSGCHNGNHLGAVCPGCQCKPGETSCKITGGTPGTCAAGFCAPKNCTTGSEGCACYAAGTCDAKNGVPMTCKSSICTATTTADTGTLGGSCDANNSCTAGLDCVQGMCEEPGCPSGELGCPCGPYGACADYAGHKARCDNNRCVVGGCAPGSGGCACQGGSCQSGFNCIDNLCRVAGSVSIAVSSPDARACDLKLTESGDLPLTDSIQFAASVHGASVNRSPTIGVSFIQRQDEPFAGAVARIEPKAGHHGSISIASSTCYDRLGNPIQGAQVSLH